MKKYTLLLILSPYLLFATFKSTEAKIDSITKNRMIKGNSWRERCPVPLKDLRYITITYKNFNDQDKIGEMIVHKSISREVREIFAELYANDYRIRQMKLSSYFGGDDDASMKADNTSAFNCRLMTNGSKWSKHSYGKAIDINPLENPYISKSGKVYPASAKKYANNRANSKNRAIIVGNDTIVRLFKSYGWKWGGDWKSIKDYQHFEKSKYIIRTKNKKPQIYNHDKGMF